MNTQLIFKFLKDVAANNNRPWFAEHKEQYLAAKAEFERGVEQAINALGAMDESVAHLTVKDCVYRFIATRASRPISRLINGTLALTSLHMAERDCMQVITSICSRGIV